MSEPDPFKISEAVIDLWRCYTIERDMAKELEAENARLKAEVERLTKAGDAMLSEWANGEEKDAKNFLKALVIWNAAKEGKQS